MNMTSQWAWTNKQLYSFYMDVVILKTLLASNKLIVKMFYLVRYTGPARDASRLHELSVKDSVVVF